MSEVWTWGNISLLTQETKRLAFICHLNSRMLGSLVPHLFAGNLNCPVSHMLVLECSISCNLVCMLANYGLQP
jgi:hypothetical protein